MRIQTDKQKEKKKKPWQLTKLQHLLSCIFVTSWNPGLQTDLEKNL